MSRIQITISNDRTVTWDEATDDTGEFLDGTAIVTMTLKTAAGVPVANAIDIPLPYVEGSNGTFRGVIDSTVTSGLTAGNGTYRLELIAVYGVADAHITLAVDVVERTS